MFELGESDRGQIAAGAHTKRVAWVSVALLCFVMGATGSFGATFTASVNPATVAVGESTTLTLQFQGGEPRTMPAIPEIPGLRIIAEGPVRSVSVVNGQYSSSLSQQYNVTPLKEGEFTIPALSAEVGGQVLSTSPVKVVGTKGAAGTQLAFLRLRISENGQPVQRTNFYLGEVLTVELHVFVNEAVANAANILQSFDQYAGTTLKSDGLSVIKAGRGAHYRWQENGVFSVGRLITAAAAVKPGPLTIGSIEANLDLQLPSRGQRRRDAFDPFGFFEQYQTRKVVLAADPIAINILPLPTQNVPPGFHGAVGIYTNLTATAGPTNVAAGDPVTVKVQIAGHGHLESLVLPDTSAWKDFKGYPPTSRVDSSDPLGVAGVKTFEQVVVPQSPEVQAIPALSFSFFDPVQKSYRSLASQPIPLVVRPAGSQATPTIATTRARDESAPPTADIVYIKPRIGSLAHAGPLLIQRPGFIALQFVPVAALAGAFFWRRRTDALANNPRLRRQRRVTAMVREGLKELRELAGANKSDELFAALFRLMQEQLGERLDLPATAITEAVIEERLRPKGVSEPLLTELQSLFQSCNQARYAPIRSSQELEAFLPRVEAVCRELQSLEL